MLDFPKGLGLDFTDLWWSPKKYNYLSFHLCPLCCQWLHSHPKLEAKGYWVKDRTIDFRCYICENGSDSFLREIGEAGNVGLVS